MDNTSIFMDSIIIKKHSFQFSESAKEKLIIGIRFICLFLFLYTAYAKTIDHDRFLKGLARVHLIGAHAVFISYAVPTAEVLISILLLIPKTAKTALYAFASLMTAFTVYITSAMLWEPKLPCHCGGAIEKLSWTQHIWFNLAFIVIAIVALRLIHSIYH
jgi:hypothetical protein